MTVPARVVEQLEQNKVVRNVWQGIFEYCMDMSPGIQQGNRNSTRNLDMGIL
jgi:hypothetical protein